jgi:hypothetical protein
VGLVKVALGFAMRNRRLLQREFDEVTEEAAHLLAATSIRYAPGALLDLLCHAVRDAPQPEVVET